MSNILNLLSEETFIEKMDKQNELLEYLVYIQGGVNYIPKLQYSWQDIQRIVRLGIASTVFNLGAQLSVNWNGEELVFDVVSFDTAVPADSARTHSMTLMLHNLPWQFEFNTNSGGNGSYYKNSTIRQWLNSSESAGNWWSSINNNVAPSYADIDGFMRGFDNDFLNVIGKVQITTTVLGSSTYFSPTNEIVEDYFYLPSLRELGFTTAPTTTTSLYSVTEGTTFGGGFSRQKYDKESNAIEWYSRTMKYTKSSSGYYSMTTYVCYLNASGSIENGNSYVNKYGICPVCNII